MRFGIGIEISNSAIGSADSLGDIESFLADWFRGLSYGPGVEEVVLGIALMPNELHRQFPLRKPRYYEGDHLVEKDGFTIRLKNLLEIYAAPDFDQARLSSPEAIAKAISTALADLPAALADLSIKNFDSTAFARDLKLGLAAFDAA